MGAIGRVANNHGVYHAMMHCFQLFWKLRALSMQHLQWLPAKTLAACAVTKRRANPKCVAGRADT